ncbi:MAG: thiamine pyrophosphate-requiring protein [Chloroflexi bacterium]|nr:thiamine pyrophosphate-requiring protein [Chloroflexota bacterium]MDA1227054.1 thiamine pyrophosphate-requiring protein [Chloroflexota bacterium]
MSSENSSDRVMVDTGGEAFVEMMNSNGVDCLFLNSGTDTFPIQEGIAKLRDQGRPTPKVILCPDEGTAIAAAHGYYNVTRKPQVVLVHVDAGTMQLGGGMHNAQRGRAGIVLCAGRAPMTFEGEMAGGKDMNIHWIQEQLDQAGALRNFTKWDYEIRRTENMQHVMQRAFQVAGSEPTGTVYMMLPREVLMERMQGMPSIPARRHGAPTTPQADPQALQNTAEALVNAQHPLIITGYSGRHQSTVAAMVELADRIGAPVASDPIHMCFPSSHPMYAGRYAEPYISDADVILVVDQDIPYIPAHGKPRPDARIIQIDIDPVKESIPLWVFPTDEMIHADSSKAVPALVEAIDALLTPADQARVDERYQLIKERHLRQRQEARDLALSHSQRSPITPQWLSYCIGQAIDEDTILIDECVTNGGHVDTYIPRDKPGTLYRSGGSSLGWGLGGAMGTKLAMPDSTVVAVVGDGSFIYGHPTSTLWASDVHDAPFLTVIYNNQLHNAAKQSLIRGYPDGVSVRQDNFVGVNLGPSVDYAMLAQSCRAYGEKVEDPSEVRPALERALEQVRGGKSAVLDVRIEQP